MRKNWKEEEVTFLQTNWGVLPISDIMEFLNRTEDSIIRKARRIGLDTRKNEEDKLIKNWTSEEDEIIRKNYGILTLLEISKFIPRTPTSISKRAEVLGIRSNLERWTEEEEYYLEEKWGIVSLESIAKTLNKSRNAVILKAWNLGLRQQVSSNGAFLTPLEICNATNISRRTFYTWLKDGKIECKKFKIGNKRKYQITPEAFLKFLEHNQDSWNSIDSDMSLIKSYLSKFTITEKENFYIRAELPLWLENKIKKDREGFKKRQREWSVGEEARLLILCEKKVPYKEICNLMNRNMSSIKTKIYSLRKNKSAQI